MEAVHERSGLPFSPTACADIAHRHMSQADKDALVTELVFKRECLAAGIEYEAPPWISTLCVRYLRASNR